MENIVSVMAWGQTLGQASKNSTGSAHLSWGYNRRKESLSPLSPLPGSGEPGFWRILSAKPFLKCSQKQTAWTAAEVVFVVKKHPKPRGSEEAPPPNTYKVG